MVVPPRDLVADQSRSVGSIWNAAVRVNRMLQSGGNIGSWLLASVLGLAGLVATIVLVYFVALIIDKLVSWCSPDLILFPNEHNDEENGRRQRLDPTRLELDDKKRIVKQLFANATFLYSCTNSAATIVPSSTTNTKLPGEDDTIEHGIELQDMSTQGTSESDDTIKVQEGETGSEIMENNKDIEEDAKEKEGSPDLFSTNEPGCCICLAPYREGDLVLRSKHCSHMYHAACCEDWILHKPVCPLCSTPMILEAEWEATAVSVLGQELYDALLSAQRETTDYPPVSSA